MKLFNKLCYARNRWEVWTDMIQLFAVSISNAVDQRYAAEREQMYMRIIRKYKSDEAMVFSDLFALLVMTMETMGFNDFFGELYMILDLGSDAHGQVFTPYSVCKMMAQMTMDAEHINNLISANGYVSINDPACGAGATLIAAADVLYQEHINYQQTCVFIGQDIDPNVGYMCYIQLSLYGCCGYVRIGDTLSDPMTGSILHGANDDASTWYTPMWFSDHWTQLRILDNARRMISAVATTFSDTEPEQTYIDAPSKASAAESKNKPDSKAHAKTAKPKKKPVEQPVIAPTFTVRKDGQLSMF